MWMAIQGRLSTQERLHQWYPDKVMTCPLCEKCLDSLNHLFFECQYSMKIWKSLEDKEGQSSIPDKWEDIIRCLTNMRHKKTIRCVLIRIILAACVYFVWAERNKRLFSSDKMDSRELTENVISHVRLKLSSLTVRRSAQILEVSKKWDILMNTR
ncbi:reverse transcriptase domain, Reverse transcriptase zinc-binding domain protein [Artemisia annua]|uniref:Reverse transcriptase domain, Reverse transcriptase zinc-binding domain protein n=1 Tax=Artemisia annua TaxID=35608 RepID=A0A2U1M6Z7_ARTAN|nr:reverse transcriptase domain, Reverse transcriptase zinc-binding domain protein [Artemisia annua]